MLPLLALLAAITVVPVHGTVLDPNHAGTAIIRNDPVTGMLPPLVRAYRVEPQLKLAPGEGVDGFVDRSTTPWRWYDAAISGRFVAGLPDPGKVTPIDIGVSLPHTQLVDQRGRLIDLARDYAGKVVLISFVFTRCPDKDECPLISSKYTLLQGRLDPRHFHLVEITLDPRYDSPAVLAAYARQYDAKAASWSILTGQQHEIKHLLDRFGISSLQTSNANFIHNDKLFVVDPKGVVTDVIDTAAWSPGSIVSEAEHTAGMVSNPFGRLELSLIASAVALCGGSQFAGIVLLETGLFFIILGFSIPLLGWVARKLWKNA